LSKCKEIEENMDQSIYVHLLTADPVASTKTALRFFHFIGLAFGLGAATLLDLMLLKFFVRERISRQAWNIVHFSSHVVNIGLIILWITGWGFLTHYALFDPAKLLNEKIWAKLVIVYALSVNGIFIHAVILPKIKAQIGKSLFDGMGNCKRTAFIVSGAVSATSWYLPVVLGAFPQLNFKVPASTILSSYCILLTVMILAMHAALALIDRIDRRRAAATMPILFQPRPTAYRPRLAQADIGAVPELKRAA
jgi:hypothetical protein